MDSRIGSRLLRASVGGEVVLVSAMERGRRHLAAPSLSFVETDLFHDQRKRIRCRSGSTLGVSLPPAADSAVRLLILLRARREPNASRSTWI